MKPGVTRILLVAALAAVPVLAANASLATAIESGQRAAAIEMIAKKSADVNAAAVKTVQPLSSGPPT